MPRICTCRRDPARAALFCHRCGAALYEVEEEQGGVVLKSREQGARWTIHIPAVEGGWRPLPAAEIEEGDDWVGRLLRDGKYAPAVLAALQACRTGTVVEPGDQRGSLGLFIEPGTPGVA